MAALLGTFKLLRELNIVTILARA
ncbi:hypothetical protein EYZ11_012797 [Aspergillus tanneri]|uniref:Uncharacterized protein n=1 Tax=Aspergillus tanneri TaxID=1220188 RepID=A0A4S3IZA2_9EURO|nr:hypothetical protein EYZ11_012797 [Aspergillus tanneri]